MNVKNKLGLNEVYSLDQKQLTADILKSIKLHKENILNDMNLTIRLTVGETTYITKLVEWSTYRFIIEAPLDKLDWVLFEDDTKAKVSFVTKTAIFGANSMIRRRYRKPNTLYYVVELSSPLERKQQRQHFRLDVLLNMEYRVFPKDEDTSIEEIPYEPATGVNISLGGMCMTADKQLFKEDKLQMRVDFLEKSFSLVGKVLMPGEKILSGRYMHRIQFKDMDAKTQSLLNRLIFEKQRLLLSQTRKPLQ